MAKEWIEIVQTMRDRQARDSVLKNQMIDIRDKVNGDWVVPLVDVKGGSTMTSPTPAFIEDAIDGNALKAASTHPMVHAPAVFGAGTRGLGLAEQRRAAFYGCWRHSKLQLSLRRGFRHIAAYGITSAVVEPDFQAGRARITWRDPLTAYPNEFSPEDLYGPTDCGWIYGVHPSAMVKRWPQTRALIEQNRRSFDDGLWDFAEWMDEDSIVLGVLGPRYTNQSPLDPAQVFQQSMELKRIPNRAGVVTAVAPCRVTLDRVQGQAHAVVGLVELIARMTALDVVATEKSIFPDKYIVGRENQKPKLVRGQWLDGRTGEMNILENVEKIGEITSTVGPNTQPMIDRLERGIRLSSGYNPAMGGETFGSLRTGQGIDRMTAGALDPRVQELHEIMSEALTCLNRGVAEVEKGWFPSAKIVAFSGWAAQSTVVEYVPEKIWETGENQVEYPTPGMESGQAALSLMQAKSAGLMSTMTALAKHPMIDDPVAEARQIAIDRTDDAVMTGFVQQVASGQLPLVDAVRVRSLLGEGKAVAEAIAQAQREAQERQAAQAPPPDAGMSSSPEAQPGLAMPGMGVEQQAPPQAGPPVPAGDKLKMALQAMAARGGGAATPSQVPAPPTMTVRA